MKVSKNWWKIHFSTPYYNSYSKHKTRQLAKKEIAFIKRILKIRKKSHIIDLSCGYGRHSIELAKQGFRITGIDFSKTLLDIAKKEAKKERVNIDFSQQDMRSFIVKEKADLVISIFSSFGYFHKEEDHIKVLKRIHQALKKDGMLFLDIKNSRRNFKKRFLSSFTSQDQIFGWSMRIFTPKEIKSLLKETGFVVKKIYGDWKGNPLNKKSFQMLIIAQKPK